MQLSTEVTLPASQTFQNDLSRGGKVVVCQLNLALVNSLVIILTTGSLEVECGDHDAEYEVEDYQSSQAERNDQQGLSSSGQACGEYQVGQASREGEASAEAQSDGNSSKKMPYSRA